MKLALLLLLLAAACSFPRPEGLAGDGGQGQACKSDGDCTQAGLGICDTAAGTEAVCVACLPDRAQACTGAMPVCGGTACRACAAHSECASDACLPEGACAAEAEVVYLKQDGTGNMCTKMSSCGVLQTAIARLSDTRKYLRVTGVIESANGAIDVNLNATQTRVILGQAGAVLRGGQGVPGASPILVVRGGAQVEVYEVEFRDAQQNAVRLEGATSTLKLQRIKVTNAGEEGVYVSEGSMTLLQSEVSNSGDATRYGVRLDNGELVINQSKISENKGGGITVVPGGKFTITNSFIVANKVGGGIRASTPADDSKLEFNTIVDNASGTNVTQAGGVVCDKDAISARNNIIFRNTGGPGGMIQKLGACVFDNSFEAVGGTGTEDTLKFKTDTGTTRDYHLTSMSPSSVKDITNLNCTGVDYDGEARPMGGTCDLGADELKQ
jgi:hypothetical protein